MIPIYKPFLEKYKTSAINAIDEEWISNYGKYITLAENELKNIVKCKYVILMNNGTSATSCIYIALKYKYPNLKKIYVPNNVFIAVWNCGLLEYPPNIFELLKINENTLIMDTSEEYIKTLEKNSAIVIVHNLGNIINVARLKRIRPDIILIEDNCEGLFGKYEDNYTGCCKDVLCSSISFYANKTITTGEGGAFLTNDNKIYKHIKQVYSHGMTDERYIHNTLARNYRMTNICAGLLYDQLKDYNTILTMKKTVFDTYHIYLKNLIELNKIKIIVSEENTVKALWMFTIIIPNISFKLFENYMIEKNIQIRPIFYAITKHEHLKKINYNNETLFSKEITNNGIMLPSYPELKELDIKYICLCIQEYLS